MSLPNELGSYDLDDWQIDEWEMDRANPGSRANIHKQKKHIGLSGMGNFLDVHYRNEVERD